MLHLCAASGTGARVFSEYLPLANPTLEAAAEFNLDPIMAALNGGEDYELLFTIPVTDHAKIKNHPDITVIGHLTEHNDAVNLINEVGPGRAAHGAGLYPLLTADSNGLN